MYTNKHTKNPKELSTLYDILAKQRREQIHRVIHMIVGMGTCGITAGSRTTMQAILAYCAENNLNDIVVFVGPCIGYCDQEPIVQVQMQSEPYVIYGKVTPDVARRILEEHVCGGNIVEDHRLHVT